MTTAAQRPARDPGSVAMLRRRISAAARSRASTDRRMQSLVGNVALAQMLPPSAVKGGTGLKLRFGESLTRQTPDLDTAFRGDRDAFARELKDNLKAGWGNFTGTVTVGSPRVPDGVPAPYVMQPLRVTLLYHRRNFVSIDLEVGYDELQATAEPPELSLSMEVTDLFAELGLATPQPVRVLPLHHQISQKLHACTQPGNTRAHDLVDLQLMAPEAQDALVAATTERLFRFRQQHPWPSHVEPGADWASLYATAAEGLPVLPAIQAATAWANDYIDRLAAFGKPS